MRFGKMAAALAAAAFAAAAAIGASTGGGRAMAGTKLVEAGAEAPDFRLNDHEGKGVRLSEHRGKAWVALAFFPKALTGGWTREVCSLRDAAKELEGLGVKVFGMSLDDVQAQAEFVKQQSLNFPLLSDPDASASGRLGVLMEGKPYTNRITVVVDDKGIVRLVDSKVNVESHGKDLVEAIRKLKP